LDKPTLDGRLVAWRVELSHCKTNLSKGRDKMLSETLLDNFMMVKLRLAFDDAGFCNITLGLLAIVAIIVAADYAHMLYLRSKMPPGPFPLPIIGNTFSLPDNKPWIYFEQLSKKYHTPLITFWIGRLVAPAPSRRQRRVDVVD
jgi:hypothetical protein